MRQCRAAARLSREWSTELLLLLGSVQLPASARLHDPTLNDTQAIEAAAMRHPGAAAVLRTAKGMNTTA